MSLTPQKKELLINSLLVIVPLIVFGLIYLDKQIAKNSNEYIVCSVNSPEKITLDKSGELKFLHYTD